MLIFKHTKSPITEALTLAKVVKDQFGANRVIVVSDLEDPNAATKEIIATKEILKKYNFKWDGTNKQWWLNDKFKPIEVIIDTAKKAVEEANKTLGSSNERNEAIQKFEDVKEFVMSKPMSPESDVTKEELEAKIDAFINDLANEVDSVRFNEKIADYFNWISKFPGYSMNNQILIYIQKRDATRVNSRSGWAALGYKPKENAQQIILWRPTLKPPSKNEKAKREAEFIAKYGKGGMTPALKEKMQKKVNEPIASMPWLLYPTYDITDVVNDSGEGAESVEKPDLDWFSTEENPVADKVFDAMVKVYQDYGIDFAVEDSKHGEKGYSANGKIRISSDASGIGRASTAIHEFAHEIMHQTFLKTKAEAEKNGVDPNNTDAIKNEKVKHILDAYVGKNLPEILELQAEGVAYVVLRAFNVPGLEYAVNYIALWKGDKDAIIGNLDVITRTSNIIIKAINEHIALDETENDVTPEGHLVSANDVAKLLKAPLGKKEESLEEVFEEINEAKNIFKTILN